jgi:hypothetical protein
MAMLAAVQNVRELMCGNYYSVAPRFALPLLLQCRTSICCASTTTVSHLDLLCLCQEIARRYHSRSTVHFQWNPAHCSRRSVLQVGSVKVWLAR